MTLLVMLNEVKKVPIASFAIGTPSTFNQLCFRKRDQEEKQTNCGFRLLQLY